MDHALVTEKVIFLSELSTPPAPISTFSIGSMVTFHFVPVSSPTSFHSVCQVSALCRYTLSLPALPFPLGLGIIVPT